MKNSESTTLLEWMDLELDGELPAADAARLEARLAAAPALAAERRGLERLHALLTASRITPRADFRQRVMAGLPAAPWERRSARSWLLPVALFFALAASAGWLLSASGALGAGAPTSIGTVYDFLQVTFLAGAGLLYASWRGLGLGLEQLLDESFAAVAALGFLVVFLNILLVRLLRHPRPVEAHRGDDEPRAR